jgi:preprotein translocase subunit SecD
MTIAERRLAEKGQLTGSSNGNKSSNATSEEK